jgi:hypothetical protein
LRRAAFEAIAYFGAYDPGVAAGTTDRLVAVAQAPQWAPTGAEEISRTRVLDCAP